MSDGVAVAEISSTHSTSIKGQKVLVALRQGKSIAAACRSALINRQTYYNWVNGDEAFARDVHDAKEEGTDALEDRLMVRAKKDDTTAAIFLLKARRPEVYRDNIKHEHSGTISFADLHSLASQAVPE